jgi:hypothetical protein
MTPMGSVSGEFVISCVSRTFRFLAILTLSARPVRSKKLLIPAASNRRLTLRSVRSQTLVYLPDAGQNLS